MLGRHICPEVYYRLLQRPFSFFPPYGSDLMNLKKKSTGLNQKKRQRCVH